MQIPPCIFVLLSLFEGGRANDLYRFSPAAVTWTALSPSGSKPSPRSGLGMAATPDGMVYVFGGYGSTCELAWLCVCARKGEKGIRVKTCIRKATKELVCTSHVVIGADG